MFRGESLVDAFLFNLIGHLRFGAGFFGLLLESGFLHKQVSVLACDFCFRLHLRKLGLLFGFRFRDALVLFLFRDVTGCHRVDDVTVLVTEILDGQVDDFKAHVAHVAHGGLDGFLGKLVPVLDQFGNRHLTDDFTHVAFQNILGQRLDLIRVIVQQLFSGRRNGQVVRTDLDIRNGVHQHGDIFLRGNRLRRFDVHLGQTHIQLVDPLHGRHIKRGAAAYDPVAEFLGGNRAVGIADLIVSPDDAGYDQRRIRRSDLIPRDKFQDQDDSGNADHDPVPVCLQPAQNIIVHRGSSFLICPQALSPLRSSMLIFVFYRDHCIRLYHNRRRIQPRRRFRVHKNCIREDLKKVLEAYES